MFPHHGLHALRGSVGLFRGNPRGVPAGRVLACSVAILVLALTACAASGMPLYGDALAAKPDRKALAIYLASMAGGSAFMIVVIVGGTVRNLLIFPLARRRADAPAWKTPSPASPGQPATSFDSVEGCGGERGIRTLDTGLSPYNALAGRPLRPLGHLSGGAWILPVRSTPTS